MTSLGIDVGGTGCKCVAFDESGKQLALAYHEYPIVAGETNLPVTTLRESVIGVIKRCVDQLSDKNAIRVMTVASFGESFVSLDKNSEPLTDILLYFDGTQNTAFDRMVKAVGADRIMDITLVIPDACYSLSKMLLTKAIVDRPVERFLFIASYICYILCGEAVCDQSLACRSLLFDVRTGRWSLELLNASGIRESELPRLVNTGTVVGTLLPEMASTLGLSEDICIVIGGHDQIVNALGAGVRNSGDAVDTTGTCECITPLFSTIPREHGFPLNNYACVPYLGQGYVTYAYNLSGGSSVRWYRDALAFYRKEEALKNGVNIYGLLNDDCPNEPTDLIFLPYLQGMGGTPDIAPNAKGVIFGLTTQTRLPDLYRALLEGTTFEMRYNLDKLYENGVKITRLYACGGGARSNKWLQIKADILGLEIIPCQYEETGATGSAILGIVAITGDDIFTVAERFWRYGDPIQPDIEHKATYDARYELFKVLRKFTQKELFSRC